MSNKSRKFADVRRILSSWETSTGVVKEIRSIYPDKQTVFEITSAAGRQFFLKDTSDGPAQGRLEEEIRLLLYLDANGVPVSAPLVTDDRQYMVAEDGKVFMLFPALPCENTNAPALIATAYYNIGTAIARLHRALAAYPYEIHSWHMDLPRTVLDEAVPRISAQLINQEKLAFEAAIQDIRAELLWAFKDLPEQYIHGDCHGGNILLYHGEVTGFIDCDHLPLGPRVYDIGYLLADFSKAQFFNNNVHARWMETFDQVIWGYEHENPLSGSEKSAITYIMLVTQLLFADWFFLHNDSVRALKNLAAFYWLYQRREEISRQIMAQVNFHPEIDP